MPWLWVTKLPKKKNKPRITPKTRREVLIEALEYHKTQAETCNSPGVFDHHMNKMTEILEALNELTIAEYGLVVEDFKGQIETEILYNKTVK